MKGNCRNNLFLVVKKLSKIYEHQKVPHNAMVLLQHHISTIFCWLRVQPIRFVYNLSSLLVVPSAASRGALWSRCCLRSWTSCSCMGSRWSSWLMSGRRRSGALRTALSQTTCRWSRKMTPPLASCRRWRCWSNCWQSSCWPSWRRRTHPIRWRLSVVCRTPSTPCRCVKSN